MAVYAVYVKSPDGIECQVTPPRATLASALRDARRYARTDKALRADRLVRVFRVRKSDGAPFGLRLASVRP